MNKRSSNIITILTQTYPNLKGALIFKNSYQCLVAVMLSAQCTDKKVNEVTPFLFKNFPNFESLSFASQKDVEKIIKTVNYYKTKANHIIQTSKMVMNDFNGKLPQHFEELISLPGVGQKTANVVLTELGIANTFPVDTHVFRVSHRLNLSQAKTPKETENDLKKEISPKYWKQMHHQFIWYGRRICKAQKPDCGNCILKKFCSFFKEQHGNIK